MDRLIRALSALRNIYINGIQRTRTVATNMYIIGVYRTHTAAKNMCIIGIQRKRWAQRNIYFNGIQGIGFSSMRPIFYKAASNIHINSIQRPRFSLITPTPFYRTVRNIHIKNIQRTRISPICIYINGIQQKRFSSISSSGSSSSEASNKCVNKRCVEMLDLWSDANCGFFGQTYFMRIMDKSFWDQPDIKYSVENAKIAHDMFVQIVSYICSGDAMSAEEIELLSNTETLWSGGRVVLSDMQQSIQKGSELDEDDAMELARDLNDMLDTQGTKNYCLYYSLTVASADSLSEPEMERFERVAEVMGVDSAEILQMFALEKKLKRNMENIFGVNKR